jgi:hypothetical protein
MPSFDKSKDKNLFKETVEVGDAKITVGVYAYDGNDQKVQITRMRKNEKSEYGWSFAKLGRLTKDELVEILPLLDKALAQI